MFCKTVGLILTGGRLNSFVSHSKKLKEYISVKNICLDSNKVRYTISFCR